MTPHFHLSNFLNPDGDKDYHLEKTNITYVLLCKRRTVFREDANFHRDPSIFTKKVQR